MTAMLRRLRARRNVLATLRVAEAHSIPCVVARVRRWLRVRVSLPAQLDACILGVDDEAA